MTGKMFIYLLLLFFNDIDSKNNNPIMITLNNL